MLIAIPSKSRPWKSASKELLKDGILFVPEQEVELYTRIYGGDVVGVPREVKGITPTRNWILDQYEGEDIVFVDDDLKQTGYVVTKSDGKKKHVKLTEAELLTEFSKSFELCKSLGYKIFGLKTESSPMSQYDEKPFLFKTYVTASCMGIVNDTDLRFDESFKVKEDYEISCRHIEKYGGILGVRYIYWENHHWDTNGGCGDYRTEAMERECINKLIRKYPNFVKSVNRKNSKYCIKLMFGE